MKSKCVYADIIGKNKSHSLLDLFFFYFNTCALFQVLSYAGSASFVKECWVAYGLP